MKLQTLRRIALSALGALCVANCSPPPPAHPETGRLPAAAQTAFAAWLDQISEGSLACEPAEVDAARAATAFVDDDAEPDFVIETRALHCRTRRGESAVAYFCGTTACAFPLLVSRRGDWQVVQLMSGNHVRAIEHYRETRIQVREIDRGAPGGRMVLVREYAWRDGALVRINEYSETAEARRGGR